MLTMASDTEIAPKRENKGLSCFQCLEKSFGCEMQDNEEWVRFGRCL